MKTVVCHKPTPRQVKADIAKRLRDNPNSGPARRAAHALGKRKWEQTWKKFEELYREYPTRADPELILAGWWLAGWRDEIAYNFFPQGQKALVWERFVRPLEENADKEWFDYEQWANLFEQWLDNRVKLIEIMFKHRSMTDKAFVHMAAERMIDMGQFCVWANKDLDKEGNLVEAKEGVGRLGPEFQLRSTKKEDPNDRYVPILIVAAFLAVCICLYLWNSR